MVVRGVYDELRKLVTFAACYFDLQYGGCALDMHVTTIISCFIIILLTLDPHALEIFKHVVLAKFVEASE